MIDLDSYVPLQYMRYQITGTNMVVQAEFNFRASMLNCHTNQGSRGRSTATAPEAWCGLKEIEFKILHGLIDTRFFKGINTLGGKSDADSYVDWNPLISLPTLRYDVGSAVISLGTSTVLHDKLAVQLRVSPDNPSLESAILDEACLASAGGAEGDVESAGYLPSAVFSEDNSSATIYFGGIAGTPRSNMVHVSRGRQGLPLGQFHAMTGLMDDLHLRRHGVNTVDTLGSVAGSTGYAVESGFGEWALDRLGYGHQLLRVRLVAPAQHFNTTGEVSRWEWVLSKIGRIHIWHPQVWDVFCARRWL